MKQKSSLHNFDLNLKLKKASDSQFDIENCISKLELHFDFNFDKMPYIKGTNMSAKVSPKSRGILIRLLYNKMTLLPFHYIFSWSYVSLKNIYDQQNNPFSYQNSFHLVTTLMVLSFNNTSYYIPSDTSHIPFLSKSQFRLP